MRRGVLSLATDFTAVQAWTLRLSIVLLMLAWAGPAQARCAFRKPVALATTGDGWQIPPTWANRGLNYGTPSMVALIQRAAKRVARERPGATLFVADISRRKGGPSEWHLSHTCGRDVDLLFYAVDPKGRQLPAPARMIPFDARGVGVHRGTLVKFDTARNWALVKALLQDRVTVERMFIHKSLKKRLLAHARKRKESAALIARADASMIQPTNAGPHDDHIHVRIALTRDDITAPTKPKPGDLPRPRSRRDRGT